MTRRNSPIAAPQLEHPSRLGDQSLGARQELPAQELDVAR
jgi:hypothetical protein